MKCLSFTLFLVFLLLETGDAKCAPRSIGISFKSAGNTSLSLHRICDNGLRCGSGLYNFPELRCEMKDCSKEESDDDSNNGRCNFCSTRLNATDVPPAHPSTRYGIFFDDNPVSAYNFSADWSSTNCPSDWYARNGWLAGCQPRFGCLSRGAENMRDVFIVAQACYTTMYQYDNVANINNCLIGNWSSGIPEGEVYGEDCPAKPL